MGDISGELIFNGKKVDLKADLQMDSFMKIFPTGMILAMIMPVLRLLFSLSVILNITVVTLNIL